VFDASGVLLILNDKGMWTLHHRS